MADYAPLTTTGDGVTNTFAVPFPYLDQSHVYVWVDGVNTAYSWVTPSSISVGPAPANGTTIIVFRDTPHDALVTFSTGPTLSGNLNKAVDQARYISEEADSATYNSAFAIDAKIGAETSEASAIAAQIAALSSQNAAAASEAAALASQVSASASASTATTQANLASASETAAAASEAAALNSQTNAGASAAAASISETNANASATAAGDSLALTLAAYDNFDDRYLGAKAADPTVDNDGNALIAGAIYFNTVLEEMKVWTGAAWVQAYVNGADFLALTGGNMSGNIDMADTVGVKWGDVGLARSSAGVVKVTDGAAGSGGITASYMTDSQGGRYWKGSTGTTSWRWANDAHQVWSSTAWNDGAPDVGFKRDSAGLVKVSNGSTGNGALMAGNGLYVDSTFYAAMSGPTPVLFWDTNDYLYYSRVPNEMGVTIGGVTTWTWGAAGANAGGLKITNLAAPTHASTDAATAAYAHDEGMHKLYTYVGASPYSVVLSDRGRSVLMNTATAGAVFEIRAESSGVVFAAGDKFRVVNYANTGSVVISAGAGVTLFKKVGGSPTMATTGNYAVCEYVGSDNWLITGDYT